MGISSTTTRSRLPWPRFKLSTILVLVGIAAWMMAIKPWWTIETTAVPHELGAPPTTDYDAVICTFTDLEYFKDDLQVNSALALPALALAAFLTWKLGWAITAIWKRRKSIPERPSEVLASSGSAGG